MTETKMRKAFVRRFDFVANISRIETGVTELGVPDLYVRTKQHDIWVELKIATGPADNMKVAYRAGQQEWAAKHKEKAGLVCLLVYHHIHGYFFFEKFDDRLDTAFHMAAFGNMRTVNPILLEQVGKYLWEQTQHARVCVPK